MDFLLRNWLKFAVAWWTFLFILSFFPIRVGIHYGQDGAFDHVRVTVRFLKFLRLRFAIPMPFLLAGAAKGRSSKRRGIRRVLARLRERAKAAATRRIERFEWKTVLGTGDAAATSWIAGTLWAAKGSAMGVLARRHSFESAPVVEVVPDFDGERLGMEVSCIFRFTMGEIIRAALTGSRYSKRG